MRDHATSGTKEQRRRPPPPPPMDLFGNVRALMKIDCRALHSLIVTLMRIIGEQISNPCSFAVGIFSQCLETVCNFL